MPTGPRGQSQAATVLEPGAALGGAKLLYLLRRLATTGDVLHLGAHPDDEDGGLIAFVSHRYDARIVYWSATRGESGQNRVGPYLGEELGVYRTWEALAARQIDDGESIYGPFIDYGYSKTLGEVLEKWGEQALVREMVRAIRSIQPQVVISRWRGDASDGHGQHAASGAALLLAYDAAGDPEQFPELARVGLAPWEPRRLLQVMTGDWQPGEHVEVGVERAEFEGGGYLRLNTGAFDPITGLTYEEQAALAFNQYLTQATGSVPNPGDYYRYLRVVRGAAEADGMGSDLFAGLDRTLTSLADYPGRGSEPLRRELQALNELIAGVVREFRIDVPADSAPGLLELVRRLRALLGDLGTFGLDGSARSALTRYLERKLVQAQTAAAACLGLRLDASVDGARLTPGDRVRLRCRLWSYGPEQPREVEFRPVLRLEGATVTRVDTGDDPPNAEFELQVPPDAPLSTPYWLRSPREQYRYTWPDEPFAGEPFDPPLLAVGCRVEIGGETLDLGLTAAQRDAFVGGARELGISILPPISLHPDEHAHILRERHEAQQLSLRVQVVGHHTVTPIEGTLAIHVPPGWTAEPDAIAISLERTGDVASFPVTVTVPADASAGSYQIRYAIESFGRRYDSGVTAVRQTAPGLGGDPDEETCVREQFIARPSTVDVEVVAAGVHTGLRYAYVAAPGDGVPSVLRSLGFDIELVDDERLLDPFDDYDAIVVGPNAFLSRPVLETHAARLLQYLRDGGTLLVQYQGYLFAEMAATPYPFSYTEPHDRVSLENRPVRIVAPEHFLLQFPNEIGDRDFAGWVRDRGLYFFGSWDERYEPLLASSDPGEPEKLGGLLVATYGKGLFVYCAYSLFRQIVQGVPGAIRLFCNLLAAPEGRLRAEVQTLHEVPLFDALAPEELHELARILEVRRLEDGEYLCREGEIADAFYVLVGGHLDALDGEQAVHAVELLTPTQELEALTGLPRSVGLRARGEARVFVFGADAFRDFLLRHPELSERLLELVARRLAAQAVA